MRWENNQNLPLDKYRGHVKEFFEDELITKFKNIILSY